MLKNHYVEFMGSCPGCPESTTLKLLTQIIGDSLSVQPGVGCSLVWSQFTLFRPFTVDRHGRGVPASGSLFEDGSVFHWGSVIGRENQRSQIKNFLSKNVEKITWSQDTKEAVENLIEKFDDKKESWKQVDKLREVIGLKNFKMGEKNDDVFAGTLTQE